MTEGLLLTLQSGLPVLASHFLATLIIWLMAVRVYLFLTPHDEIALVKKDNVAAAISIGGAYLGLAIPMAVCLAGSLSVLDIVVWGGITLVIQIAAFFVIDFKMRDLDERIEKGEVATAIYLVAIKLSVAALLAGAIAV